MRLVISEDHRVSGELEVSFIALDIGRPGYDGKFGMVKPAMYVHSTFLPLRTGSLLLLDISSTK
jgi:hypothetical protein